ncbi:putative leader peptide [Streptomyces sp. NPDC101227]|uniref:putative leader peptide n=1 Tax=Streptomyces sp. NPDC101227 TaxID=3366136 RepID=UPI00380F3DB0
MSLGQVADSSEPGTSPNLDECMNAALSVLDAATRSRPGFLPMQTPQPLAHLVCRRVHRLARPLVRRRHVDLGRVAGALCRSASA